MESPSDASQPSLPPQNSSPHDGRPSGLLPAFEPTSSPRLPSSHKRKHDGSPVAPHATLKHYPTPVPTSSTGIATSSPPQPSSRSTRPGLLQRTASTVSERVPLGDVRGLDLSINGEPVLLGRSSNSSQYQLSANRLISRVHVKAAYEAPDEQHEQGRVLIQCLGWNGMRIHCQGYTTDLGKGDTFTSVKPLAEIMIGVQDARVLVRWPALVRKGSTSALTDATIGVDRSPSRPTPPATPLASSPPIIQTHLRSPVSPSPRTRVQPAASNTFLGLPSNPPSSPPAVEVYEDEQPASKPLADTSLEEQQPASTSNHSQASSSLSDPEDFSDHDEENDPIIHSFGPFGENLLPRMASFRAVSPEHRKQPLHSSVSPRQPQSSKSSAVENAGRTPQASFRSHDMVPLRNHLVNQLAFSRLHSVPLSTLMANLPPSLTMITHDSPQALSDDDLRLFLEDIPCVGEIAREGRDAAGKPLENEYYYVPELDTDTGRREAVEIGKPGLRAVRKQHKVCDASCDEAFD